METEFTFGWSSIISLIITGLMTILFFIAKTVWNKQTEAQKADMLQHHWGAEVDNLLGIPHNRTFPKGKIKVIIHKLEYKNGNTYESTHYVKCLFCEDKFECENPKNQDVINFALKEMDQDIKRLETAKDHLNAKSLKEEGERIKKRIREIGVFPASNLFFIGKK